jgi:hypothetical protein
MSGTNDLWSIWKNIPIRNKFDRLRLKGTLETINKHRNPIGAGRSTVSRRLERPGR